MAERNADSQDLTTNERISSPSLFFVIRARACSVGLHNCQPAGSNVFFLLVSKDSQLGMGDGFRNGRDSAASPAMVVNHLTPPLFRSR